MRINVLEYNLGMPAGRQQTMVAFADTFKQLGHEVKVYSNFFGNFERSKILDWYLTSNLSIENFNFSHRISRNDPEGMPIREWSNGDLLLIPYPGYSWIGKHVGCPIVTWYIAQPSFWWPEHISQVWTNSYTQRKRLKIPAAEVVYAPHDYSAFRQDALPFEDRKIDVLVVTPITKRREKSKVIFPQVLELEKLRKMGLEVLGIFLASERELGLIKKLPFPKYVNVKRRHVAGFMKASKVLLHPSPLESCSLVVFESLNSGCYPVVREAGACREQLGDVGYVYKDFKEAEEEIVRVLEEGYDIDKSIKQGVKFDRKNTIRKIEGLLKPFAE